MEKAALFGHLLGAFLFVSGTVVAGVAFEAAAGEARRRRSHCCSGSRVSVRRSSAPACWRCSGSGSGSSTSATGATARAGSTRRSASSSSAASLGGFGGRAPKRARQLATRLAADGQPVSDELRGLLADRAALLANYASALLMIAILVLMVWKPGAG